jgi:tetratricopeptide (TPR) repeat protein
LDRFWFVRGHYAEGRQQVEEALVRSEHADASAIPPAVRAQALSAAGTLAWAQGDFTTAAVRHQQAQRLFEAAGDRQGTAFSLNNLGVQAMRRGEADRALALFQRAIDEYQMIGDTWGGSIAQANIGSQLLELGDLERAETLLRESHDTLRRLGDRELEAMTLAPVLGSVSRIRFDSSGCSGTWLRQ